MKFIINTTYNSGFKWHSNSNIWVKGFFYDHNDKFYSGKYLLEYFNNVSSNNDFIKLINGINGLFSVIIKQDNKLFIASDKSRFFTLFYAQINNEIHISDEPSDIIKHIDNPQISQLRSDEFNACGYVNGEHTLVDNIKQVRGGEYLIFEEGNTVKENFFSYCTASAQTEDYSELKNKGEEVITDTFKRLIASLDNKTVVVPLSGGFDSRLIVTALKKLNYNNVVCFTYGKKDNPEIELSKKIAGKLGYKWHCIEYTEELIKGYINDPVFEKYYQYVTRYSAFFYMQEYFATKYLKDNSLVPDDSIFIPGHCGMIAGTQLIKVVPRNITYQNVAKNILEKRFPYSALPKSSANQVLKDIIKQIEIDSPKEKNYFAYSVHENLDIKEKFAKTNINSVNVFTYFDYEIRLPFWDKDLVAFFKNVPYEYKIFKKLYDDILMDRFFEPFGLNLKNEFQPSNTRIKWQNFKNSVKKLLPRSINSMYNRSFDFFNYDHITNYMIEEARSRKHKINTNVKYKNGIITQWYLSKIRDKF